LARFILDRSQTAASGGGRRRVADLTRLVNASPSLMVRERQIVAGYTDALTELLAQETGASPDDIEPRIAAETMMAFHRSLIVFLRRQRRRPGAGALTRGGPRGPSRVRATGRPLPKANGWPSTCRSLPTRPAGADQR